MGSIKVRALTEDTFEIHLTLIYLKNIDTTKQRKNGFDAKLIL